MSQLTVIQAYRHLYRTALLATHRAIPAKYTIRTILRNSFRADTASLFDPGKIANTIAFLQRAKQDTGMEHRILKNLLHVRYWQYHGKRGNKL